MKRAVLFFVLFISLTLLSAAATDVWSSHIATGLWKTTASVYNSSISSVSLTLTQIDDSGSTVGTPKDFNIPSRTWTLISETELNYNGSAHFVSSADLLIKIAYQCGTTPSVCEFYLDNAKGRNWVIPNSVHDWLDYTGMAVLNPGSSTINVILEAWNLGVKLNQALVDVPARQRYVRLSDGVWAGMGYHSFDTIVIRTTGDVPAPISITGNNANDRHLFFTAKPAAFYSTGDSFPADSIVGNLRYVQAGTFVQGTPTSEPCRSAANDAQFTHHLTHHLAVMETHVTRQMWADLKALRPTLPDDPSWTDGSPGMSYPVQNATWYEAVLFANLLSLQQGLTPCYYTGSDKLTQIDAGNYDNNNSIFCDFSAIGYRLPTEGEWEYLCRAGTTGAFWFDETNLVEGNCYNMTPGLFPVAEASAWFYTNSAYMSHPVGQKPPNPWNLYDMPGNINNWCWDCYGAYPEGAQTDYTGTWWLTQYRVERGGSYSHSVAFLRSGCRNSWYPDSTHRNSNTGFRLVRTVP